MLARCVPQLIIGCSLWAAVGCAGSPDSGDGAQGQEARRPTPELPGPTGPVVAEVGEGFVTADEFSEAAARAPGGGPDMALDARLDVLETLVTEEAMFQEAIRTGLARDPKVRKVLVNLLLRKEVYNKVSNSDFTDEELRAYYDAHKEDFVVPEKVQVKRILVGFGEGTRSEEQARAILDKARKRLARDPGAFRELASEISEGNYRRRGGDLGFLPREGKPGIDPEVAEVAFDLPSGKVSEIFETDGGLNIVMTEARRDRMERSFDQMRGSVLRKLRNERFQELTEQYVNDLRAKAGVTVDEEALADAPIATGRGSGPDVDLRRPPGVGARPPRGKRGGKLPHHGDH